MHEKKKKEKKTGRMIGLPSSFTPSARHERLHPFGGAFFFVKGALDTVDEGVECVRSTRWMKMCRGGEGRRRYRGVRW